MIIRKVNDWAATGVRAIETTEKVNMHIMYVLVISYLSNRMPTGSVTMVAPKKYEANSKLWSAAFQGYRGPYLIFIKSINCGNYTNYFSLTSGSSMRVPFSSCANGSTIAKIIMENWEMTINIKMTDPKSNKAMFTRVGKHAKNISK